MNKLILAILLMILSGCFFNDPVYERIEEKRRRQVEIKINQCIAALYADARPNQLIAAKTMPQITRLNGRFPQCTGPYL